MNVGIIGAGAWGSALGSVIARGGNEVCLWSFDGLYSDFGKTYDNLRVTSNMAPVADTDVWILVTPASFFRETLQNAKPYYKNQPIIICTKGAEVVSGSCMSEIVADVLPDAQNVGVLSGPQFATEVANGVPTGSTIAGNDVVQDCAHIIFKDLYLSDSDDIIGTQLCGIGKNAVALIAGYNSVAARGENERAMIFTRAWCEVIKLGLAMGAKIETFSDLCGIGDLFLSATSTTSRNFSGGISIARGEKLTGTVEGVYAISALIKRAEQNGVTTPILCEMRDKMKI